MGKLTKNQKKALELYNPTKSYTIKEASEIVKKITFSKFDSSVDLDIRLGVDPKKADQMVRGVVTLPNGVGKEVKVLVLCTPDKEEEAKAAAEAEAKKRAEEEAQAAAEAEAKAVAEAEAKKKAQEEAKAAKKRA